MVRAKTLLDLRGTAAVKAIAGNAEDMPTSRSDTMWKVLEILGATGLEPP